MLVIRDTRESGQMLEAAVAAGVAAAGGEALLGGVLPTPGAPLLIGRYGLDLAVVISASHNPYRDNGIKFFGGDGFKLSDATEAEIEAALDEPPPRTPTSARVQPLHGALEDYLRALHERFAGLDLSGQRVLLDCANGAAYRAAPEIFRRLGADVTCSPPPGRPQHQRRLRLHAPRQPRRPDARGRPRRRLRLRRRRRPRARGRPHRRRRRRRRADRAGRVHRAPTTASRHGVAVTVMTNYGFHTAMGAAGIDVATTAVGDRYVLEALRERGWALGGEQSGHIIDMGFVPSGDGIAAALLTLEALGDGDLAERHAMEKLPQTLVNVRVPDRDAFAAATRATRGGDRARDEGARGPRSRARAPQRHRAARARDGRGADRGRGRRRLRAPRRGGRELDEWWGRGPRAALESRPPMCGIVGYVGPRAVQDVLLAGLEKLEYRGYDSAGISVLKTATSTRCAPSAT